MNRIIIIIAVLVLVAGGIWYGTQKSGQPLSPSTEPSEATGMKSPESAGTSERGNSIPGTSVPDTSVPGTSANPELSDTAKKETASPLPGSTPSSVLSAGVSPLPSPSVKASSTPAVSSTPVADDEDDGDFPVQKKVVLPTTPAGIKGAKVWLVASDLRELPNASTLGDSFEVGIPEGSKSTRWKSRTGLKTTDGIRTKGAANGTFIPKLATSIGAMDAVLICAPDAKGCGSTQPTQLKIGPDVNHADHWLSGADKSGKSSKGGSSFTALFLAARGSANGNPLMEHQNGDAGSNKGPFLGWIGADLVASIHGSQGAVGVAAVAIPSAWSGKIIPQIYTVRFDRKKGQLGLSVIGAKGETAVQAIEKGDGPDNNEYAGIAMGSQTPGAAAATYVFEEATFARALEDKEICAIHKEWNTRYALKISAANLKSCQ